MKTTDYLKNSAADDGERMTVSRILDAARIAEKRNCEIYTDFLSPAQQADALKAAETADSLTFELWGGYETAERKMGVFKPDWVTGPDWPIEILALKTRGETPTHPEILGALTGLGLRREKLGDLLASAEPPLIVCHRTVAPFLTENFTQAGRKSFRTVPGEIGNLPKEETEEKTFTVPSLRLDCVAAEGFGVARSKMTEAIRKGLAQVNWRETDSPSHTLSAGDTVSVRGMGRIVLSEIGGMSRKDRIFVTVQRFSRH